MKIAIPAGAVSQVTGDDQVSAGHAIGLGYVTLFLAIEIKTGWTDGLPGSGIERGSIKVILKNRLGGRRGV